MKNRKLLSRLVFSFYIFCLPLFTHAAEHVIGMGSTGAEDSTSFEPYFLKVNAGDDVLFKTVAPGHYVASTVIPEGAMSWKSETDQDIKVHIDKPGYYLFTCPTHRALSMVGLIQAGDDQSNREAVLEALQKMRPRIGMNIERIDDLEKKLGDTSGNS